MQTDTYNKFLGVWKKGVTAKKENNTTKTIENPIKQFQTFPGFCVCKGGSQKGQRKTLGEKGYPKARYGRSAENGRFYSGQTIIVSTRKGRANQR